MASAKEIFEAMGFDIEAATEEDDKIRRTRSKDKRVCLCGHAMARHEEFNGMIQCSALRSTCMCRKSQPVLEVEDVRVFMSKTEGSGAMHALNRGILAAAKRGHNIEWVAEALACHRCGVMGQRLTPLAVTANGFPATYDTGYNALLCDDCRV